MNQQLLLLHLGIYQGIHAVINSYGIWQLVRGQIPWFPMPPPLEGWGEEIIHIITPLAFLDWIVAVFTVFFLFRSSFNTESNHLKTSLVSAAVFGHTLFFLFAASSGAWSANLLIYSLLFLGFCPIYGLLYSLVRRSLT